MQCPARVPFFRHCLGRQAQKYLQQQGKAVAKNRFTGHGRSLGDVRNAVISAVVIVDEFKAVQVLYEMRTALFMALHVPVVSLNKSLETR